MKDPHLLQNLMDSPFKINRGSTLWACTTLPVRFQLLANLLWEMLHIWDLRVQSRPSARALQKKQDTYTLKCFMNQERHAIVSLSSSCYMVS